MSKYILSLLLVLLSFNLIAQPELKFIRYTTEQGLTNNDVLSIFQDTLGFLWFGTKYGCSRFDGVEFKNYQYNESDSGTINDGWVKKIINDNENNLWFAVIGLGGSLMQYDYKTEKFIDVSPLIAEPLNIKGRLFEIWNIYPDGNGGIWTKNTAYEFIRYDTKSNTIDIFNQTTDDFLVNPASYKLSGNELWFNSDSGIFIYNIEKNLFINYKHDPDDLQSLSSDKSLKILRDSRGDIWIATFNGLNRMIFSASGTVRFEHFKHNPNDPFSLSSNLIYDIVEDNNGNLLIATVNGLCMLDKNTNKIYRYFNNEIDNESINSNLIRTIYKDNQGNIWIGTDAGVAKLQVKNFKSYSKSLYKNSISHNKVQYFCELPNSDIWIATPRGIDVFDREKEEFDFLLGITQNSNGLYGAPLVLCPDANKGMWIGAWNGGFSYFNYLSRKVTNYITMPETRGIMNVSSIFTDNKGNLWIGTDNGVYVYDNKKKDCKKKFSQSNNKENSISSDYIRAIYEDFESNIWIGTFYGLNKLIDFENGIFKKYLNDVGVKQILQGANNCLWFATGNGLYKFNKLSQEFKKFDKSDGLPGSSVLGILEDSLQNLWISTVEGFAKLKIRNDSVINVTSYHKEDGIKIGEFLERSCIKLQDGTMMFGGTEGFFMFHPSKIKTDTLSPKVVFTNLKVGNKHVNTGQEINGQVILEKSITLTDHITLNYKNNAFSVQFAGLQCNMSEYNQYGYKLYGYERNYPDWQYTDAENRKAEFINLPSGNYTLKVKAANSYGIWSNQLAELKITILPPWWRTIWFISLMVILLILFIVLIVRIRTYNLHKQKQKLAKIVEQRTVELKEMNVLLNERKEELEAQAEELSEINLKLLNTNSELEVKTIEVEKIAKQLHEADQSKLRFFANVSHEFRTPLSLIIAPLEKLFTLKQPILWDKTNISDYHQLMLKNAKRLFRLINQVIDFRKIEYKNRKLDLSNNNILEFTKEVIDAFSVQAEQKNISLNLENQCPTFEFWFDPDIMEKILYNLISNAIKYTPGGEVNVQLSVNNEQSTVNSQQLTDDEKLLIIHSSLLIKIADTGIGIKKENLDRIFDRFYREDTSENSIIEGTGIGLAYTKELVELHNGSILVESELGKGTVFILQFLIENKSLEEETSVREAPVNLNYIRSMMEINENPVEADVSGDNVDKGSENEFQEGKPSILLVEDNTDLRKFIKSELTSLFNVHEAKNGKKGLELAMQIEPDLIISDIMMPVMDGIEFCKKIKDDEQTSHIPVFLLTAKSGDDNVVEGFETGADDYIFKPFNMQALKLKLKNFFNLRKKLQEQFSKSLDMPTSEITYSTIDDKFIEDAMNVVKENLQNPGFDNEAFVESMTYSRALIYKKIKILTNQSLGEFINSIRVKTAARLFNEGNQNIKEVSYNVGFKHPNILTRHFKKAFGIPPSEYIKNKLKNS